MNQDQVTIELNNEESLDKTINMKDMFNEQINDSDEEQKVSHETQSDGSYDFNQVEQQVQSQQQQQQLEQTQKNEQIQMNEIQIPIRTNLDEFLMLFGEQILNSLHKLLFSSFLVLFILFFTKQLSTKSFVLSILLLFSVIFLISCCLRFFMIRRGIYRNNPYNFEESIDVVQQIENQQQQQNLQAILGNQRSHVQRTRRLSPFLARGQTFHADRMVQFGLENHHHHGQHDQFIDYVNNVQFVFNDDARRQLSRRITNNQMIMILHQVLQSVQQQEETSNGLNTEEINSLPCHVYSESEKLENQQNNCIVCLVEFDISEEIRTMPACLHQFHKECIDTWLQKNKTCPICRQQAQGD